MSLRDNDTGNEQEPVVHITRRYNASLGLKNEVSVMFNTRNEIRKPPMRPVCNNGRSVKYNGSKFAQEPAELLRGAQSGPALTVTRPDRRATPRAPLATLQDYRIIRCPSHICMARQVPPVLARVSVNALG